MTLHELNQEDEAGAKLNQGYQHQPPTTTDCYLLPTTYYLLPTTYYLLPTTYYLPPII